MSKSSQDIPVEMIIIGSELRFLGSIEIGLRSVERGICLIAVLILTVTN